MLSMYWPDHVVGGITFLMAWFVLSSFSLVAQFCHHPSLSRAYVHDPQAVNRWDYHSVRVIAFSALPGLWAPCWWPARCCFSMAPKMSRRC